MDQETLVEMQIEDGGRLIERLIKEGIGVTASWWAKESDGGLWYHYLATDLVGEDGAVRPAYRRVNAVIRQMQQEGYWVDPFLIKVVSPADPVTEAVLAIHKRIPRPFTAPLRWSGTRLGDVDIEEAYLYPLPVAAR